MTTGEDGLTLIKHFEGCVLLAYPDPATGGEPITIGIGHTGGVRMGDEMTEEEAMATLARDLRRFEKGVDEAVHRRLEQHQFDACVSLSFNIGLGNFKNSTLVKKLNNGDDAGAAVEFLRWDRANGKQMRGLSRRRRAESLVFAGMMAEMAITEATRDFP